jgi:hypothetical protein
MKSSSDSIVVDVEVTNSDASTFAGDSDTSLSELTEFKVNSAAESGHCFLVFFCLLRALPLSGMSKYESAVVVVAARERLQDWVAVVGVGDAARAALRFLVVGGVVKVTPKPYVLNAGRKKRGPDIYVET